MKLISFAGRVRGLVIAAGLALAAGLAGTAAHADTLKIDPAVQAKSMQEAPQIIATIHANCDPANAYNVGQTEAEKDGKKVKASMYEIACKSGPGFMVVAISPTEITQSFTCTLVAGVKEKQPNAQTCQLPENQPHYKWMTPVVQSFAPGCEVSNGRLIGSTPAESTDPKIDRYEFACQGQAGGILDYPQFGSDAKVEIKSCLVMAEGKTPCTFTTADQASAFVKPLAAAADKDCQVNNTRFVGVTKEEDGYYYEFGCANKPGFIVLSKTDNKTFVRSVPCASAAGLGGCKFTDAGAAAADANTNFTNQLKAGGFACTVKDYNVIGTQEQTKRDYIEFKCPEQPWGLIGFVPQPGSTSTLRMTDCFIDQTTHKSCTYVTADMLKAQVDKLIKTAEPGKNCDVSDVRYIGESDALDNGVVVEVACANKRGYIGTISPDRNSFADTPEACRLAKAHGSAQQCEIPGNGTYSSADD